MSTIVSPSLDAEIRLTDPDLNIGESEDASVGGSAQSRLILEYPVQPGQWTQAILRFQTLTATDDNIAPGHAQLSIIPLVGLTWPLVETSVTADTTDGTHNWPFDPIATEQGGAAGMSDNETPRVDHPWPVLTGATDIDFDISPIIRSYPESLPQFWRLLVFSSEETLSAVAGTSQKEPDGLGVLLVLEQRGRSGGRAHWNRAHNNRAHNNRAHNRRAAGRRRI